MRWWARPAAAFMHRPCTGGGGKELPADVGDAPHQHHADDTGHQNHHQNGAGPVSYTHLDVYKRQDHGHAGDAAHEGKVLAALMGCTVLTHRDRCV